MLYTVDISYNFFRLLRNALWQKGEVPDHLNVEEFKDVFALAKQQAVSAMIADSLIRNNVKINDDCTMFAMAEVLKNRRNVKKINESLVKFVPILNDELIHYVVFKGQVSAFHYLNPELRSVGDIDFYVIPRDFCKAEQLLKDNLHVKVNEDKIDKHFDFKCKGIRYEMHYKIETFGYYKHQKYFNQLIDNDILENSSQIWIDQVQIKTLSPIAEIISVFKHLFNHLLVEGVGLKQLCDLAILLHSYYNKYDKKLLKKHLRIIGYYKAFVATGAFIVKDLGLPKEEFPFVLDEKHYSWADKIRKDVLKGGNFGKNIRSGKKNKSLQTAFLAMTHCMRYFSLAPLDITYLIPKRIGISLINVISMNSK